MRTNRRRIINITKKNAPPPPPRYIVLWQRAIIVSFFTLLFGLGIYRLATPTPTVSELENRELKAMPVFSFKSLFSGGYTKSLEDFYADTFLFRDAFIQANDTVSLLYKIPLRGVDTVMLASDNVSQDEEEMSDEDSDTGEDTGAYPDGGADDSGTLLASSETGLLPGQDGPSNEATAAPGETPAALEASPSPTQSAVADGEPSADDEDEPADMQQKGTYLLTDDAIYRAITTFPNQYGKLMSALNRLQLALPSHRIITMVPPESYALYAPAKYYKEEYDEPKAIQAMYATLNPGIMAIDVYPILSQHTSEYIYFRTDHHWTARGAYWAYTVFAQRLGFEPQKLESMPAGRVKEKFLGSYYNQFKDTAKARLIRQNPDYVEYFTPTVQNTSTAYENTTTTRGKNAPVIMLAKIPNNVNYYRTFLGGDYPYMHISTQTLNGQSIMIIKDSYADAFVPFLLAHYQDIYVVDYRDYNASGKPRFRIVDFVNAHNVQDVMVISSFDLTNSSIFMNWLVKAFPA